MITAMNARCLALLCLLPTLLSGCYSLKKTVAGSKPLADQINWPADYQPEAARFFVHNEIAITASAEQVWEVLIKADEWADYYDGASDLLLQGDDAGRLQANTVFTWRTMGQNFSSAIKEYEAPYRLSWLSEKENIQGYHAWLIVPTETGCTLVTSEVQHGPLAGIEKRFVPNKLHRLHDRWLAGIKYKAENP